MESLKLEREKFSDPTAFTNVRQHLNFEPNFQMTYVKKPKSSICYFAINQVRSYSHISQIFMRCLVLFFPSN